MFHFTSVSNGQIIKAIILGLPPPNMPSTFRNVDKKPQKTLKQQKRKQKKKEREREEKKKKKKAKLSEEKTRESKNNAKI